MQEKSPKTEKLQKVLANAGVASRREAERWIAAGRVRVDGRLATLGDRVGAAATLRVDGRAINNPLTRTIKTKILMYNKPEGEVCTRSDPKGRKTVFDNLPGMRSGRWIMIGRLDVNTSGLLLFTNDGALAHRFMHPSSMLEREYAVRVYGHVEPSVLAQLKKGVNLEDGPARFASIRDAGGDGRNHWYHVVLKEGRNRLVRRLWESQGVRVSRLIRVRYGKIALPRSLRTGKRAYHTK